MKRDGERFDTDSGRSRASSEDEQLRALVALAKKMPHTESARRDAASFASFETTLQTRRARRPLRLRFLTRRARVRVAVAGVGLASCVVLGVVFRDNLSSVIGAPVPALSYVLKQPSADSQVAEGETVRPEIARELAFSDGSRVQLAPDAQAGVSALTGSGARVELAQGRAEVSIARRKNAAWQLVAGPYTVRVTGTAFRLVWSREREELEVAMRHGSVVVTGPMAESGVVLGQGQRLLGSPRARRLLVEPWSEQQEQATLAKASAPSAAVPEAKIELEPESSRASARNEHPRARGWEEHGWSKQIAQGNFAQVLAEAKSLGHARVLGSATVSDLGALADAARYARQEALGEKTLLALRERFPASEAARDSAFLLGRLSRDQRALAWYERYLKEQPSGSYVSQALGRSMMLYYELGDAARAKALAHGYLERFPQGPYAAAARKLLDKSRSGAAPLFDTSRSGAAPLGRADSAAP